MRIFILLVGFCLFLFSCNQKKFDSKEELLAYLQDEENGYIQKKTVNGIEFSLMYRPPDLVISQMFQSKNVNEIDSLRKKYDNYLYFNLAMSKNNREILNILPTSKSEYGEMVNQFAFMMEEKIHLVVGQRDTIPMKDYIFGRMYGMAKSNTLLLIYPKTGSIMNSEKVNLMIEDFGGNTGIVTFKFPVEKIKNRPILSFEKNNEKN